LKCLFRNFVIKISQWLMIQSIKSLQNPKLLKNKSMFNQKSLTEQRLSLLERKTRQQNYKFFLKLRISFRVFNQIKRMWNHLLIKKRNIDRQGITLKSLILLYSLQLIQSQKKSFQSNKYFQNPDQKILFIKFVENEKEQILPKALIPQLKIQLTCSHLLQL